MIWYNCQTDIGEYLAFKEDVSEAISILKHGKSYGYKGLLSDPIICGLDMLFTLVALLITTSYDFSCMATIGLGIMYDQFVKTTIIKTQK